MKILQYGIELLGDVGFRVVINSGRLLYGSGQAVIGIVSEDDELMEQGVKNLGRGAYKMKKFSISALSLIICGFSATSALADTYSDGECAQLSYQYDDTIQMLENWKVMEGTCQIGHESICTRTDYIEMQQAQENLQSENSRLKEELITDCPSYAEGL